ncbi:MAG: CDP-alcohol phosphatidyltransferase family protein [Prevotella sp.]
MPYPIQHCLIVNYLVFNGVLRGITDMINGTIARLMGSISEFGAKFDTSADIIFIALCLSIFFPLIGAPTWLWIWIIVIAIINIGNIILEFIYKNSLHHDIR